jgi:NADPH2:quinone reductase
VSAVGEGVSHVKVGDRVIGSSGHGAFAEKVLVNAGRVIPMPAGADFETAAAFMLTYGTSYHGGQGPGS